MSIAPTTSPRRFCFVLMPFADEFEDVYELGIKAACHSGGAYCERVDEQIFHDSIMERIYNQIAKADFIVADMTGRNPNVFYEVGYAHALGKPTILLTQNVSDIPFDLKQFPHIVYGAKITTLRDQLTTRIRWFVENAVREFHTSKVDIRLFLGDEDLSSGSVIKELRRNHSPHGTLTIHNASTQTFTPGAFKIGIVTSSTFLRSQNEGVVSTELPSGGHQHMYPDLPLLFPDSLTSFEFCLEHDEKHTPPIGHEEEVVFRVFTSGGTRDYPLTCKWIS